jgi:hypothetical protein
MIPKKFLSANKRMKLSYVFGSDGHKINPEFEKMNLVEIFDLLFPYQVVPGFTMDVWENEEHDKEFDLWMRTNIHRGWTLWVVKGDARQPLYLFEHSTDAIHFKLRWS